MRDAVIGTSPKKYLTQKTGAYWAPLAQLGFLAIALKMDSAQALQCC